jgi:hypothetical protein
VGGLVGGLRFGLAAGLGVDLFFGMLFGLATSMVQKRTSGDGEEKTNMIFCSREAVPGIVQAEGAA